MGNDRLITLPAASNRRRDGAAEAAPWGRRLLWADVQAAHAAGAVRGGVQVPDEGARPRGHHLPQAQLPHDAEPEPGKNTDLQIQPG